jgi:hypothetical protein
MTKFKKKNALQKLKKLNWRACDFKYLPSFLSIACLDFVDCLAIASVTYETDTIINYDVLATMLVA